MAVADDPLLGLGYAPASVRRSFFRIGEGVGDGAGDGAGDAPQGESSIAEEVPVALVYNGRSHVVVMATPADLEDLAAGFSLTERIITDIAQLERVEVVRASHGIELQLEIPRDAAARLDARARGLVARTGCGLCGVETIAEALRVPTRVGTGLMVHAAALWRAGASLDHEQTLNAETRSVHAAGWATRDGELRVVREDVGRHNALDKTLGALARAGEAAHEGFVIVTSRASYEMVQKAATCGVELMAAISRPTGLAIRFAEAAGVTLAGLVRGRTANVYTGHERIVRAS